MVSDFLVRVQLHSDRLASKFDNSAFGFVTKFASLNDRDFSSVEELDGFSSKYIKISHAIFSFSAFKCREVFYLHYFFSQKTTKLLKIQHIRYVRD